jgi:hypothetical protein
MKRFGKIAFGALMMAGTAVGASLIATAPADAAHVSVGIGIGVPGPAVAPPPPPPPAYYGPHDAPQCVDRRWAYLNSKFCPSIYGVGGIPNVGQAYYGYYDSGFYGPGYYEPVVGGFWFTDSYGHRRWRAGRFDGRGFHGRSTWHHH